MGGGGQATGAWNDIPGMKLHWSWTPKASDEGREGKDAAYWAQPPYTPSSAGTVCCNQFEEKSGVWKIAKAPDGSLAFEMGMPEGIVSGGAIAPILWPNDASKSPHVWRLRYRVYLANSWFSAHNDGSHLKFPGGLIMGPQIRAGGEPLSKEGESCNQAKKSYESGNERSATVRVTMGASNRTFRLYTYHVPEPGNDCPIRYQYKSDRKGVTGKWMNIEIEFKNQSAKNVADGYQKMWVDSTQILNIQNILWVRHTEQPQGFRGPWFIHYYGGCCPTLAQNTKLWLRDIEVWVK